MNEMSKVPNMSVQPPMSKVTPGGGQVSTPAPAGPAPVKVAPAPTKTTSVPKAPTTFSEKQTSELDSAALRRARGQATSEDIKNLTYAESKGYKYNLTSEQIKELDVASSRTQTPTDVKNIEYAKTKGYAAPIPPAPIVKQEDKNAINDYKNPPSPGDTGFITSKISENVDKSLKNILTASENNPLPTVTDIFAKGSLTPELPPELQTIQTEIERLKTSVLSEANTEGISDPTLKAISEKLLVRQSEAEMNARERADLAVEDQELINANAIKAMRARLGSTGMLGTNVEVSLITGAIQQGERALREIALAEREELTELRNNYEDKQFELALKNVEMIENRRKQYLDLSTSLYQMKLSYQDQLMKIEETKRALSRETVDDLVKAGYSPDQVPDYVSDAVDTELGRPKGFTKQILDVAYKEKLAKDETDALTRKNLQMESVISMTNFLKNTAPGGKVLLDGIEYSISGTDEAGISTMTQVNQRTGEVYAITFDPKTKTGTSTLVANVGTMTAPETIQDADNKPWIYDATSNTYKPGFATTSHLQLDSTFKAGTIGPTLSDSDPAVKGECAAMNNYFYGSHILGNQYNEKLSAFEDYGIHGAEEVQIGDSFLMESGSTGHVGFVVDKKTGPDGEEQFLLFDSNSKGDDKIAYHWEKADNPAFKAFATIPTPNMPATGTGTNGFTTKSDLEGKERLSDTQLKNYRELGYAVTPGMTQEDVWNMRPTLNDGATLAIPTLSEFSEAYQNDLKMSVAPEQIQEIYSSTVAKAPAIASAAQLVAASAPTVTAGKQIIASVQNAIEQGDIQGAKEQLLIAARAAAPSTEQTKIRGRETGIVVLTELANIIQEYKNKGGDTDLLKGTETEIRKKLGTVKDPALVQISQIMQAALIDYRQSVSGAAFTAQELEQYKGLFPSISDTYDLNVAKIDGLITSWRLGNDAFYETMLGGSLYSQIFE